MKRLPSILMILIFLLVSRSDKIIGQVRTSEETKYTSFNDLYDVYSEIFSPSYIEKRTTLYHNYMQAPTPENGIAYSGVLADIQNLYSIYIFRGLELALSQSVSDETVSWLIYATSALKSSSYSFWKEPNSASVKYIQNTIPKGMLGTYSAEINTQQRNKWESGYPLIKESVINWLKNKPEEEKISIISQLVDAELVATIVLSLNSSWRSKTKFDLNLIKQNFKDFINLTGINPDSMSISESTILSTYLRDLHYYLLESYRELNLTNEDMLEFFKSYENHQSNTIRKWFKQRYNIINTAYYPFPFNIKANTIDGNEFDLSKHIGKKIILLDFWGLGCGSCIKRMPYLKALYEKYRNQSFEIISINVGTETQINEIAKVESKIGAGWPTIVIGGKNSRELSTNPNTTIKSLMDHFEFITVPQMFLLDYNGKTILYNGILTQGDFEPILKNLLNTELSASRYTK